MAVGVHGIPGVHVLKPANLQEKLLDKGQDQENAIILLLLEVVHTALKPPLKIKTVIRNLVMV